MLPRLLRYVSLVFVAVLLAAVLPACSTQAGAASLSMLAADQLPAQIQSAPVSVRTAYQFAVANPDVMKGIPCYCGCGNIGHTSNYSCYVTDANSSGVSAYDYHALGCSLCVDITQDAMRLLKEGKTVPEIKAFVDANYSKYGVSNMP